MNCKRAEQLIPLHTSGDLQPLEADILCQHIETCAHCQQIAEEFANSQAWLSEFSTPSFDEAVFTDLRTSVLQEIKQTESAGNRGKWFERLLPSLPPRWAMAAIAAAVVLFGVWAGRVIHRAQQMPKEMAIVENIKPQEGVKPPIPQSPQERHTEGIKITRSRPQPAKYSQQSPQLNSGDSAATTIETPSTDLTAENPTDLLPTNEPTNSSVLAKAEPVIEREMLRIELQTADPNIRIIWFAPKTGKTELNTK